MRFVHTSTLRFHEVADTELGKLRKGYAILSHRWTWGEEEIQYLDVRNLDSSTKEKGGYAKFTGACELAKKLGFDLIWIDTCCINKQDSVELSEAINSMYRWYSMAETCFAYLEDISGVEKIGESEWWKRGWTLQELIAPRSIRFYGRAWKFLGDKASLCNTIVKRTGIPIAVLKGTKAPQAYSVAQRMSWAAERTTLRIEDRAYSLMGLFDVNMPMIYGERERAFLRLQEHIMAKSADESIFVWHLNLLDGSTRDAKQVYSGLLAPSPACFAGCGDIVPAGRSRGFHADQFGMIITAPASLQTLGVHQAVLQVKNGKETERCALTLAELPDANSWARVSTKAGDSFTTVKDMPQDMLKFVIPMQPSQAPLRLYHGLWLRSLQIHDGHVLGYVTILRDISHVDYWPLPSGQVGTAGVIRLKLQDDYGWIKVGFDASSRPVCSLIFSAAGNGQMLNDSEALIASTNHRGFQYLKHGAPQRVEHQFFRDDWIKKPISELKRLPQYQFDSRLHVSNDEEGFDIKFLAPQFEVGVVAERVPDPNARPLGSQSVWAISITVGTRPDRPRHDDWLLLSDCGIWYSC